jgi:dipeptidyl aminopeptidase/acylaminoacyl peptidase
MIFPVSFVIPALVSPLAQVEPPKANWKLANRFTAESLTPFVPSTTLAPGWINKTDTFWYSWRDDSGRKFWKVDPKAKKKTPLFDTAKMAASLSELTQKPYDSTNLPFSTVTFDEKDANRMFFSLTEAPVAPSTVPKTTRYEYDLAKETLKIAAKEGTAAATTETRDFRNLSPDKKAYVYAMAHNLYYVEIKEGKDQPPVQLTKDGEKDYSFGSREGGFGGIFGGGGGTRRGQQGGGGAPPPPTEQRVRANVTWSKDSKRFYVSRFDSRKVKELFLVSSLSEPRPSLLSYKYAMPGEPEVGSQELFAFNPEKKALEKLPVEKYKDQQLRNVHFQDTTSETLRFLRRDRLQRHAELCEINLATKAVTPLVTEAVENAFLELQEVKYVKPGGDFLWFSERSGWGHYYLYSNDGKLKNAVTSGPYRASSITEVDEKKSQLWFVAQGREAGENPYYQHLYHVGLDGSGLTLTDAGEADHTSSVSPSKDFVVDVSSRPDLAPKAVLRDRDGKMILDLEETKLERLLELGWRMPERFTVKAADGVNDLYGNLWKPTDFDPKRKYPIIAYVYPGPQTESVNSGFSVSATNARLAQLGFIVIQIGNRGGNPARSNAYHSYGYYNLRDYGLADKKTGIEQLAARFPWVDIDKVGIFGHSGGGFMTGAALLLPPYNEFFKVGVSSAGNHDNNIYNANWSEQHHGLKEVPVLGADGKPTGETKFEIKVPTNAELAGNLKGKLLLVHGEMDNNVHPGGTIRLVNALIKAGKRFDFMMLPGQAHGFGEMTGYFNQMTLEYFAEHLLGDYQRGNAELRAK